MYTTTEKASGLNVGNASKSEEKGDTQNMAHEAGQKVRNLFTSASNELSQANDKVIEEIRTNPVRSSIIALGAGMLLGVLIRR